MITIFGLGNVGSNVFNIFKKKKVFTFSINNRFNCLLKNNTKKYNFLFKNRKLFIELIGNIFSTIEIILNCIKNLNYYISANKDLVSKYIFIINFLFKKNKIKNFYEASVCGSLPIIDLISNHYFKEKIFYFFGILNGTCNYILTNIKKNNFKNLIKTSIKKGFAEKQYKNDLLGLDTVFKSSILISKIFNLFIFFYNIYLESIFNINKYLKKINYTKRYIFFCLNLNNYIFLNVSLFLIKNFYFKKNYNSYNSILLNTLNLKKTYIIGIGAGGKPTSTSVISDFYKSFKKFFFNESNCIFKRKILNKNYLIFNYIIKINFNYNKVFILFLLKIKFLKIFIKKNVIFKTKKIFYKKILFFLYFFKKKFFINKIL